MMVFFVFVVGHTGYFQGTGTIGPAVREGYRGTLVPLTSALAFLRKLWKQHLIISTFTTKRGFKR